MTDMTRRTVVRGTAWSVPVIAVAAAAPAFAVSKTCQPFAECKKPGSSQDEVKTYVINSNCGGANSNITAVFVDTKPTTLLSTGRFETVEFKDSRNFRTVLIEFSDRAAEEYTVAFPPCKG